MTSQSGPNAQKPNDDEKDGKRGPTHSEKIVKDRARGIRLTVEFNDRGQVTSPPPFQSFLGAQARAHIPITIADWTGVSPKLKESIWDTIYVSKVNIIYFHH